MGGEAGTARQLAGLLRGGGGDLAAQRVARLVAEACAGVEPAEGSRQCAALRDSILQLCSDGTLTLPEARLLCRKIDGAQAAMLEALSSPQRALDALERALSDTPVRGLPELAVQGALSADSAALLIGENGQLVVRATAGLELPPDAADAASVAGRALLGGSVVEGSDAENALRIRQEIDGGRVIRNQEVRWKRKDGTHLDLALSAAPLRDPAGAVSGSIAILVDITDRKQREEQVERTARFREHFVGIVSHDLRNPLTAIVTSAQLLLRYGELPERQARVVARIASSADRMARMIDDLLDFARSKLGGEFPIHRRRIDLRQICEQTVEELEFAFTRQVKLEANGDLWGDWDPDRIAQVISNLVGNAVQHSDGDVKVTLRGEVDVVVLETHNGGPPIPREVLSHIFEPGRRGDARSGGLGLGLFIVQQIVLAHGGSIEVTSNDGDGTKFTVALPRKGRHK